MSLAVLPGSVANATSTPLCCPTGTNPLPPRAPCKVLRHRAPDSAPRSDLATQDRQHLALHDACTLSKTVEGSSSGVCTGHYGHCLGAWRGRPFWVFARHLGVRHQCPATCHSLTCVCKNRPRVAKQFFGSRLVELR